MGSGAGSGAGNGAGSGAGRGAGSGAGNGASSGAGHAARVPAEAIDEDSGGGCRGGDSGDTPPAATQLQSPTYFPTDGMK